MMTSFFSSETPRIYQKIATHLKDKIEKGEWKDGTALPSERDLAKQFNVSRTSVREAIIALEVAGWVEVKMGSGVYAKNTQLNQYDDFKDIAPFSLLQARLLIEPETAALAAQNMNDDALIAIKQAYLINVSDNIMGSKTHEGDRLFHIRIAEASGNDAYALILKQLIHEQSSSELFTALRRLYTPNDMPMRSQQEHYAILMALEQRDAEKARQEMRQHLENVIDIFMRGKEQGAE